MHAHIHTFLHACIHTYIDALHLRTQLNHYGKLKQTREKYWASKCGLMQGTLLSAVKYAVLRVCLLFYVYVCVPACMYVCHMHGESLGAQKRG